MIVQKGCARKEVKREMFKGEGEVTLETRSAILRGESALKISPTIPNQI